MAVYTFDQFRRVLTRLGFRRVRSRGHESWQKVLPNGSILRVRISHRHGRDIPRWLFYEMLRQTGITETDFRQAL